MWIRKKIMIIICLCLIFSNLLFGENDTTFFAKAIKLTFEKENLFSKDIFYKKELNDTIKNSLDLSFIENNSADLKVIDIDYFIYYENSLKSIFSLTPKIKRECKGSIFIEYKNEKMELKIDESDILSYQEAEFNRQNRDKNLRIIYNYNHLNFYQPLIGGLFTVGLIYLFYENKK